MTESRARDCADSLLDRSAWVGMSERQASIILYSMTIVASLLQLFISSYVFFMLVFHRLTRQASRVDCFLYANTYLTLIIIAFFCLDMSAYAIYGDLHADSSFQGWWCQTKAFVLYGSGCTFFYSFLVQAIYRLVRILHRLRIPFQSFRLYSTLSVLLWPFVFSQLIPSLCIGDIEYVADQFHCQFAISNLRASLTVCSVGFFMPFTLTSCCYFWTMFRVHQQRAALATINQRRLFHRDLLMLKRLVILLAFVTSVAAPHAILPIIYLLTSYLPRWIVALEWLLTSLALLAVAIVLVFLSSRLRKIFTMVWSCVWSAKKEFHSCVKYTRKCRQEWVAVIKRRFSLVFKSFTRAWNTLGNVDKNELL